MKIGTLTFHITSNYGALLQAYALQKVLNRMGHSSEIINYQFPGSEDLLCRKLIDCKTFKRKLEYIKDIAWCAFGPVGYGKRLEVLRSIDFIKNYLPVSDAVFYTYQDLAEKATCYDAYITGSDQVWNPNLKETSGGAYLLDFVPEGRIKISYGASFGVSHLSTEQSKVYGKALHQFKNISVREQEGLQIVREAADRKDAYLVLDPTMLMTQEDWLDLAVYNMKHKDYILCYFLDEFEKSKQFVLDLQSHFGLPVLFIGFRKKYLFSSTINLISGAGPREFLGLFANASIVVTNSFHGTVFSILFRKSFYAFLGTSTFRKAMNGRLNNLSNILNLNERIGESNGIALSEKPINYDEIELILNREREKSLVFLKNSLDSGL